MLNVYFFLKFGCNNSIWEISPRLLWALSRHQHKYIWSFYIFSPIIWPFFGFLSTGGPRMAWAHSSSSNNNRILSVHAPNFWNYYSTFLNSFFVQSSEKGVLLRIIPCSFPQSVMEIMRSLNQSRSSKYLSVSVLIPRSSSRGSSGRIASAWEQGFKRTENIWAQSEDLEKSLKSKC